MIYMDNAASSPLRPEVLETMLPYMRSVGNPSSIHRDGRSARRGVEGARRHVAALLNADPSEILFTSGGTEANNTALRGVSGGRLVTTSIEHESVLEPCRAQGARPVTYLEPDSTGTIPPETLDESLSEPAALVSIMTANNEVGTIQDVRALAGVCRRHGAVFHTDMVQAAGKIPVDVKSWGVDMASVSAHKIGGPMGVGALYVRSGTEMEPLVLGGGQESGMRSGTENVAGIVGFGEACRLARAEMSRNIPYVSSLRDQLVSRLLEIPHSGLNGHPTSRLPGNAHLAFLGVNGEDLIIKLDENGIAASTGSACSVHTQKESHVLRAMNLPAETISSSLRLTLGPQNTSEEVGKVAEAMPHIVSELRAVSPLRERYGF
ncbi:MAG: cysteine desulfurase [Nitrosopumilaceae archaeon]|nr:cysteine desulfurase [Nitrosopumilaceae archaeon]